MLRNAVLAMAVVGALAWVVVVAADQQAVYLKDGRKLVGQVLKTDDGYQIKMSGGTVVIAAADVLRVENIKAPEDEFKERLAKVDPKSPEQLYALAVWAADNELLTQAKETLLKVLALKPEHEQAKLRLRLVEIKLSTATQVQPVPSTRTVGPVVPTTAETVDPSMFLKQEDIYRIRLIELRESDNNLPIEFRNDVINRFVKQMQGTDVFGKEGGERKFRGASRGEQARYILENTDREDTRIRDDILVKDDPTVIREFKTRLWPVLSKTCAASVCHGGVKGAGGLRLFNLTISDPRVLYTNFYILTGWSKEGVRLANRDDPKQSLLLQYGLPQNLSERPHPKKVDAPFPNKDNRDYKLIEEWIGTLHRPFFSPGYRVKYNVVPNLPQEGRTDSAPAIQ